MSDKQEHDVAIKVYTAEKIVQYTQKFLNDEKNTLLEQMAQVVLAAREIKKLDILDWDKYFEEEENGK